jgi:hypothetical protein
MSIFFHCTCGKKLQAKDELAGKRLKCPSCQKVVPVPGSIAATVPLAKPVLAGTDAGQLPPMPNVPEFLDEDDIPPPAPRFPATSSPNPWIGSLDQQSTPWQGDDKERLNRGMVYREVPEFVVVFLVLLLVGGLVAGAFYFWGADEKTARIGRENQKQATGVVEGKVTYKGAPLPSGSIAFHLSNEQSYEDGIQPDGTYQAVGLKPGPYKVTVVTKEIKGPPQNPPPLKGPPKGKGPPPKAPPKGFKFIPPKYVAIPQRYADPNTSGLMLEVKAGKQPFNIDLTD